MFLFKKIVSQFFLPLPFSLLFCFVGIYLLWRTKKQKCGKVLVTFGISLITLFSFSPIANGLLALLENQFQVYSYSSKNPSVKYVVVLGGGHTSDIRLSPTSRVNNQTLKRLIEGIQVQRANPGSKLVLSGGSWLHSTTDAQIMAEIARGIGVLDSDIIIESQSKDTRDEAVFLKSLLGTNEFYLVTSASHMPRSVALFRKETMRPFPVPAGHMAKKFNSNDPEAYCPTPSNLLKSEFALYEYLGLVWTKLNGAL